MLQDYALFSATMSDFCEQIRQQRPMDMPIRIDFISHRHTFWHSLAPLMLECRSRATFAPRVILGPCEDVSISSNQWEARWMEERGIPWLYLNEFEPNSEETDLVVFTTPYASTRDEKLHPYSLLGKGIFTMLIPYCTEWLGGEAFAETYFGWNPLFWRTFAASALSQKLYMEHQNIPEHRVPVVGNPEYDVSRWQDLPKYRKIKEMAQGRKVLLWTPHYEDKSIFRWCTWAQLGEVTARILHRYQDDLFVVMRPHHFLRAKLQSAATDTDLDDSFKVAARMVHEAENFWIDDSGQCLESVLACDGLISDCSSLLAKAMRLGKSVLYTRRAGSDGAESISSILQGHAHITEEARGIQLFVEKVLRGKDELLPLPEAIKTYLCGVDDGRASARIADYLERYFLLKQEIA